MICIQCPSSERLVSNPVKMVFQNRCSSTRADFVLKEHHWYMQKLASHVFHGISLPKFCISKNPLNVTSIYIIVQYFSHSIKCLCLFTFVLSSTYQVHQEKHQYKPVVLNEMVVEAIQNFLRHHKQLDYGSKLLEPIL